MKDKLHLWLIKWGIWSAWSEVALNMLLMLPRTSSLHVRPLVMVSSSRSLRGRQTPPSEEDCAYLVNLLGPALEEELATLARYTQCAFAALALGGTVC